MIVSLLTVLSQLAAFFKLWFTARYFGVGSELDGYNLALVTPTLISGIVAGVIQTGFFPVRARVYARFGLPATEAFERAIFWGCVALGAILALLIFVSIPWLTQWLTAQSQPSVHDTFLFTLSFVVLLVPLNIANDCMGYILAMREKFAYAAGAPIVNGILGGLILLVWPGAGLLSLVLGTLIGLFAQLIICLFGLSKSKFSILGALPTWRAFLLQGYDMLTLGGWVLPGVFFSNMASSLPMVWAASYGEGVVSSFGYAYRLHTSLVQLLVMSSSTLLLARFSMLVVEEDYNSVRRLLRQAALVSFVIGVASTLLVWFLGEPLLLLLFGGRFDSEAAYKVTQLWFWLTTGVGFALLGNVFAKLWQAQSRPKLLSFMAASSLLTILLCYFVFRGMLGAQAIALALSAAPAVVVLLGFRLLTPSLHLVRAHN
ncbi:lipid II flippase MurJ [Pseudomonas gingeri]|uniref:Uncharacterized protein n=1 Tax=Pseudomonas gingeri TaxID=117681 RepID=A0A7Y7WQF1_9PSED|nr:hypothetical protein [Pseudomonas gingeri]